MKVGYNRHGWTASDASARLVEEGLRRAEFAFVDFRDSAAGRQACLQGSSLAVWEVVLLLCSYKGDAEAVAAHLRWPRAKVLVRRREDDLARGYWRVDPSACRVSS